MKAQWIKGMVLIFAISWGACSDNDSEEEGQNPGSGLPTSAVETAFWAKYPSASGVKWEAKGVFQEAEFAFNQTEYEAWFKRSGEWLQTEYTVAYASVPAAVRDLPAAGSYPPAIWTPEETAQVLERRNYPVWYGVELENGNREVTVWADATGYRSRDIEEEYSEDELPVEIRRWISLNYKNGYISEAGRLVNGTYEVNLLDGIVVKIVHFDRLKNWQYTSWPILLSDVPQRVKDILTKPAYQGFSVRNVSYQQYPSGDRYHFDLKQIEMTGPDIGLNVDLQGNIIL